MEFSFRPTEEMGGRHHSPGTSKEFVSDPIDLNSSIPVFASGRNMRHHAWLLMAVAGLLLTESAPNVWAEGTTTKTSSQVLLTEPQSTNELYEIQNPFAFIPRLLVENQFDFGQGSKDAMSYALRPRPVLPFRLTDDLALITRTTFNIKYQQSLEPNDANRFGLGDTDMELFLSPSKALADGTLIVGVGPILRLPTATQKELGLEKWGLGPTAVVSWQPSGVKADHGWTFSFFANHLFDYAGNSNRNSLSDTYLQPVVSYTFKGGTSLAMDTQSVYSWVTDKWVVPINFTVSQMVKAGSQPIIVTLGGRYFAEKPVGGPEWGGQLSFIFLFSK